jgi:hypothetical protein
MVRELNIGKSQPERQLAVMTSRRRAGSLTMKEV